MFAGCGGGSDKPASTAASSTPTPAVQSNTVTLKLIAFKPEALTVKAGTAVTWKNEDGTDHSVTSGVVKQEGGGVKDTPDGKFDSGTLGAGKSFSFTFASAGTYTFYCKFHPATMRGTITVT